MEGEASMMLIPCDIHTVIPQESSTSHSTHMWRRPVAVCGLIRSVAHQSPVQVPYTDVTHAVHGTDGTREPSRPPHDQIFRLPKTPSVLTSTGSSVTTKPQELPRAATSILRRNHLSQTADIYHQATGISPQAHPLICCRCCRKTPLCTPPTHTTRWGRYLPKLLHPMALRLSVSSPQSTASSPAISSCRPAACGRFLACVAASQKRSLMVVSGSDVRAVTMVKSGGLETTTTGADEVETPTAAVVVTGQVTEVCKDTFWPIVKAAGEKPVVLDMYTQWCGPCKVMAPKFQQMSEKDHDVVFLKLDCNQDNRPLAKELGIRVVPTFKIFKDGKVAKEVTGAKIDELARAIEEVKSS